MQKGLTTPYLFSQPLALSLSRLSYISSTNLMLPSSCETYVRYRAVEPEPPRDNAEGGGGGGGGHQHLEVRGVAMCPPRKPWVQRRVPRCIYLTYSYIYIYIYIYNVYI